MQSEIDRNITIPKEELGNFCKRWGIKELAVFGSVLRADFGPNSDIDLLVTFHSGTNWGLLDHLRMEQELGEMLGRNVDVISKQAVQRSHNWLRRPEILDTAEVVYGS